jgi:c-di-GMP-binding flagellar brake protein YcgR
MPEYASLTATESIVDAFNYLKDAGTLIRMVSERAGFERLIIVTDLRRTLKGQMVVLDAPADLETIVLPEELPSFRFEYTGPDGLKYIFHSNRPLLRNDQLWIALPETIERIQRRSDYRVTAPMGTYVTATVSDAPLRAKVLDISTGGLRCRLSMGRYGEVATGLQRGQSMVGLDLHIPREGETITIHIHTGRIEWLSREAETGRLSVALSFQETAHLAVRRLTREIYHIQRRLLRLRKPHI